jgi:D-beta-D-heptose 7-phosphate kinase/D-beta-D-heptose 1-phosphate adenosyltransferase
MILGREDLAKAVAGLQSQGKRVVFTNGCFDIIHAGHVEYLAKSRELGDVLVIGLNTDASVKRLKGESRPINSETDRAIVLDALKYVDFVCLFDEDTPLELIRVVKPNVLTKGGDYSHETIVGADFVVANGGEVVVIPLVAGKSTTNVINKMNCGK